jgi:hypothetical protein
MAFQTGNQNALIKQHYLITKYKKNSPFLESFHKIYDRTDMF